MDREPQKQGNRTRRAFAPHELTEEMWAEIERAAPSEEARQLDHLMRE